MKFKPGFENGGLSITPQRTSSTSRWHKAPETGVFPTELSDTYPFAPYLVTEICCALQAAYPAGDGSVAILRSMPPNNCRVRCDTGPFRRRRNTVDQNRAKTLPREAVRPIWRVGIG